MNKKIASDKLLDEITSFIFESRALLEQGAFVQLAGLDSRIKDLCENVLALSQQDRRKYAAKLEVVMAELSQLGDELAHQRDATGDQIRGLADHRKANVLYRTVNVSDKKDDE